jgi:hypothetical protein
MAYFWDYRVHQLSFPSWCETLDWFKHKSIVLLCITSILKTAQSTGKCWRVLWNIYFYILIYLSIWRIPIILFLGSKPRRTAAARAAAGGNMLMGQSVAAIEDDLFEQEQTWSLSGSSPQGKSPAQGPADALLDTGTVDESRVYVLNRYWVRN